MGVFAAVLALALLGQGAEARLPKKTVLSLALDQDLEANKLKKGKEFKAKLSQPVMDKFGTMVLPVGSEVKGKVAEVDERHLRLKFREIKTPSGKKSIDAKLIGVEAENIKLDEGELEAPGKSGAKRAANVGAAAAGRATGGMTGTAVKGLGRILFGGGGKALKLKKGTVLRIELQKELKLKV